MVGLIHIVLFDLIESAGGQAALAEVKKRAGVARDKTFRIDEAYDDHEVLRLFEASGEVLHIGRERAEQLYAQQFLRDAQRRWPMWFEMSKSTRQFLERQPAIHNGFATGVRDAAERQKINDKFVLEKHPDELIVHYRSPNQLCWLYKSLARLLMDHYGDQAAISEPQCMKNGDPECEIHVLWSPTEGSAAPEPATDGP